MGRASVHDVAVLGHGSHPHPRRGACLLELAGTLPGGPWTGHPGWVDPVLGALARAVNDHTSDPARRALVGFAPWLLSGPAGDSHRGRLVAGLVGRAALGHADPADAERLAAALGGLTEPPREHHWRRWERLQHRRRPVRLVRFAVRMLSRSPDADDLLARLLQDAVNLTRALDGLPPVPAATRAIDCPPMLPVRVEVRVPDGAESTYYHCVALLDQWPIPLAQACAVRAGELRTLAQRTPAEPRSADEHTPVPERMG